METTYHYINDTVNNVDNAPYSEKHGTYTGASGFKDGLIIDGQDWIVKYPKNTSYLSRHEEVSYTNDHISEYLGSRLVEIQAIKNAANEQLTTILERDFNNTGPAPVFDNGGSFHGKTPDSRFD